MYNDSDLYRYPSNFFTVDEAVIGDTSFQGTGRHTIFPFKRNQFRSYLHGHEMNRDMCKQPIQNEWSVGLVSNRFRIFLGYWFPDDALFPVV